MNNRIMAMLFALVAAMFISIVPVKAEAAPGPGAPGPGPGFVPGVAAHTCWDFNGDCVCDAKENCTKAVHDIAYRTDAEKHISECTKCGEVIAEEKHTDWSYTASEDGTQHTAECGVCGYTKTEDHTSRSKECRCKYCLTIMDHKMVCDSTTINTTTHWEKCEVCGKTTEAEEHTFTVTDNGDKTHTRLCETCGYELKNEACSDSSEDEDCLCDTCGAETSNHAWKEVKAVAPTCTEDGMYSHYRCTVCEKYFEHDGRAETTADKLTIAANGHDIRPVWSIDANQHWHECKVCGDDEKVELGDHVFKFVSNGTETHTGTCEVCNKSTKAVTKQPHVDANNDCVCDADGCGYLMHETTFVAAQEKTCTEKGWNDHHKCSKCGGTFYSLETYEVVDPTIEPSHDPISTIKHDEDGHYQICRDCKEKVNFAEHNIKYISYDAAQHTVKCTYTTKNSACEYKVRENHVDANKDCVCDLCERKLEHTLVHVNSKAATCTEAGNQPYDECTNCGVTLDGAGKEIEVEIEALGHDWLEKGYTLNGKHVRLCQRSDCQKYETIDHYDEDGDCFCDVSDCTALMHSHTYVAVAKKEATCTEDGHEAYLKFEGCGKMFDMNENPITAPATIKATGHDEGGEWTSEGENHVKKCTACGEIVASAEHADKNYDNRCDVCSVELALEYMPQIDPTCTAVGYKACWRSAVTGRMYADENGNQHITAREQIPATGHTWGGSDESGTCHVCDDCGALAAHVNNDGDCICDICYFTMNGHTASYVAAVAPTCEEEGTKAYVSCSCGKKYDAITGDVITAPATVPATGHTMSDEVKNDSAEGDHYIECVVCGYELHENHVMAVEDPLKGNYHQWVCACGEIETAKHSDSDGDNKCDECKHDMSGTSVKVEQHDSVTVITGNPDTVEPTKSWWQNWLSNLVPGNASGTTASKETTSSESTSNNTASNNTTTNSGNASTSGSTTSGSSASSSVSSSNTISELINMLNMLINMLKQAK